MRTAGYSNSDSARQGPLGTVQLFFVVTTGVGCGGATGTWRVEARAAAKHPTMYRTASHNKEVPGPKHHWGCGGASPPAPAPPSLRSVYPHSWRFSSLINASSQATSPPRVPPLGQWAGTGTPPPPASQSGPSGQVVPTISSSLQFPRGTHRSHHLPGEPQRD